MSDPERGAYAPPNEPPLVSDPRHGGGGRRIPFTLIVSVLVLAALVAAIFVFYRSGVRQAGQAPQAVGEPMGTIRSDAPPEAQPKDPAAGLQIYKSELPEGAAPPEPKFAPPPEQPQPRTPAPAVVVTPAPVAPPAATAPATGLRPSLPATPPPAKAAPVAAASAPTPKVVATTPAPQAAASGTAAVQIGAFSTQALADQGLAQARAVAPAAAAGRGQSIQRIERDGGALYRTALTGFPSREAATAFCNQLKAAGKSCFVR